MKVTSTIYCTPALGSWISTQLQLIQIAGECDRWPGLQCSLLGLTYRSKLPRFRLWSTIDSFDCIEVRAKWHAGATSRTKYLPKNNMQCDVRTCFQPAIATSVEFSSLYIATNQPTTKFISSDSWVAEAQNISIATRWADSLIAKPKWQPPSGKLLTVRIWIKMNVASEFRV